MRRAIRSPRSRGGSSQKGTRPRPNISRIQAEVDAEVLAATDDALAQPQPRPTRSTSASTRPTWIRRGEQFDTEDDPQFSGEPTTMVDLLNACMRDEMRRDPKILAVRRGRRRRVARGVPRRRQGQGRRLQGHVGTAEGVRRVARLQLAARRGEHRRAARSGWRRAGSSRWSRCSSSTTSGRRTCSSATSSRRCAGGRTTPFRRRSSFA